MNTAILLAGGAGERAGSKVPKQFTRAAGHMMITYTLKPLLEHEKIDSVYVVADKAWKEEIMKDALFMGLDISRIAGFATPGANRQASVISGMQKVGPGSCEDGDTVLIHDAARPYLTKGILDACFEALEGHDGVMPVLPMKDTVYQSEDGRTVSGLLKRDMIFAGQAPELFDLKSYYNANLKLTTEELMTIRGASEPAVLFGLDIVMIPGDEKNSKVTTAEDLRIFKKCKEENTR